MAFLVRKIARAKWPEELCEIDSLEGDAIADLRTTKNTLSLWYIDEEKDLEIAALALAASSKSEKIDSFSVVWIPIDKLLERGFSIVSTEGDTIVKDLTDKHRDLNCITYGKLGDTADLILHELICEKHYKKYTKAQVKKFLVDAYSAERICKEKCHPSLLTEIEKALGAL